MDGANITPRQVFGPIEATNALVGNNIFGSANISFNETLGDTFRARAEKDACLRSLAFGEIHARRHDIAVAHPNTCDWLFQTPEFRRWRDPNDRYAHLGVLWIKGKPGAGKSTLMKHAFFRFQDIFNDHLIVAHFFNARGSTLEMTSLGLLRSIVYQLLQDEELYSLFQDLLRHKKLSSPAAVDWQWRLSELQGFVRSVVTRPRSRPFLLLVDALDECDESQARDMVEFLESLSVCAFQVGVPLHICLSSRHYPSIRIDKVIEVVVETSQDHTVDIAKYISDKLRTRNDMIESKIIERADGIFLWVVIVVAMLNKADDEGRVEVVQKTLDEVPNDLDKVFASILKNASNAGETLLILQWVLLSTQPLELSELFAAVFQGVAPPPIDVIKRRITTSSRGLVEVRKGSETVQFIHLSVKDFLYRRKRLSAIDPSLEPEPIMITHGRLWARCWTSVEQAVTPNMGAKFLVEAYDRDPFLVYAASNILHHANLALTSEMVKADRDKDFSDSSNNIQLSMKEWLRRPDRWLPWWKSFLNKFCLNSEPDLRGESQPDLVYLSALFELPNLLRASLAGSDIDANSGYYGTALGVASYRGSYHIALLLIDNSADVNVQSSYYGNALQAACLSPKQDEHVLRLLLKVGAEVNAQGGKYGNALQAACLSPKQDEQVLQLLLEAGAEVNAQGGKYGNALQAACFSETPNKQIVRLLLKAGANVNAQGGYYGNALQAACYTGLQNEQIARLLLKAGANVNAQGGYYGNALQAACYTGLQNEQIARLLLKAGANVNAQGGRHHNALRAASSKGHGCIVQLLLDAGATANMSGA
ncbi:ankyrin repeat domain-containing protein 50 [Microdochium nivale]|nr:ankyrin repeat domain-containing protein 50 [Microdochium nivale]